MKELEYETPYVPLLQLDLGMICTRLCRNELLQISNGIIRAALHPDYMRLIFGGVSERRDVMVGMVSPTITEKRMASGARGVSFEMGFKVQMLQTFPSQTIVGDNLLQT